VTGSLHSRRPALVLALAALCIGGLLFAAFAVMVLRSRAQLVGELHRRIIEREAAVLRPFALQQVSDETNPDRPPLTALLRSARQEGMIAVAVFDAAGSTIGTVPTDQFFVELPIDDYVRLQSSASHSRFHPDFPLDQYFAGVAPGQARVPVLEVLLAVPSRAAAAPLGFVRYTIDGRPLARELAAIDARLSRQSTSTLALGAVVVALVMAGAAYGLHRAQRTITERNDRLTRAHFELTLAAKASVLGQITSHLIHSLQGPVAGLRAAVATQGESDWRSAADYAERMQAMIQETVALLRDIGANARYEIDGPELAAAIRERSRALAAQQGVELALVNQFSGTLDGHRGGILCLITGNLVQNAIAASTPGQEVQVSIDRTGDRCTVQVRDHGGGIPEALRPHLFTPGRSGHQHGSGLGLAISRLMAMQIGAELTLESTGPAGTVFVVNVPL
jgi:signal transduction histidine kinase